MTQALLSQLALDGGVAFYAGKMHSGSKKKHDNLQHLVLVLAQILFFVWEFCGDVYGLYGIKIAVFPAFLGRFWCLGLFERCSKFSCGFHTMIKTLRQSLRFTYVSQVLAYDTYVSMI